MGEATNIYFTCLKSFVISIVYDLRQGAETMGVALP